jgi:vitamin B12 transporter
MTTSFSLVSIAALWAGAVASAAGPPPYQTVVVSPADQAASSSVVTDDRTPRGGEDLPRLLGELSGAAVTRFGGLGSAAFVSLRGSTWEQVRIYVDGVPQNLAAGGAVDLSAIPLGSVERIEVYRAMSPIAFGASGLGGIVSITTHTPRATGLKAELGGGSFGTRLAGVDGSWAGTRLRLYVGVHGLVSRGDFPYFSDNGTAYDPSDDAVLRRQNNQLSQADGVVRAVWDLSPARSLTVSSWLFQRRQGLPGYSIYRTSDATLAGLRGQATLHYHGREDLGPGGPLDLLVYGGATLQRFRDPLSEISIAPADTRDLTVAGGATGRASRSPAPWLRLSGVLDGRAERFRPSDQRQGATLTGEPAERLFGSAGLEADLWWRRLGLDVIPTVRLELARDRRSGRTAFGALAGGPAQENVQVLPRLGLVNRPSADVILRANVGRYARLPSFVELYGNSGFLVGNLDLAPESAWNGDLGGAFSHDGPRGGLTVEASLFGAMVDDLIQFQQDAYGRAHPRNIGHARILGVESQVQGRLGRWGRLLTTLTFDDARDTSASTASRARQLPLRPRFRSYTRPELRGAELGGLRFGAYSDLDVTSGDYLDPANLVEVPRRVLVGAGAWVEWPDAGIRLLASAQNLGDSRISDVAGFPLPGRAFYLTLSARLVRTPASTPTQEPIR